MSAPYIVPGEMSLHVSNQWATAHNHIRLGQLDQAAELLEALGQRELDSHKRVEILSSLASVYAANGREYQAIAACEMALRIDPSASMAKESLQLLTSGKDSVRDRESRNDRPRKIAILSLLFNWPSTGGGTIHTYELAKALGRAGYNVCHIFAQHDGWQVGEIEAGYDVPHIRIPFVGEEWKSSTIKVRFRAAIDLFSPDYVIVTDSWNCKPLLAEAAAGIPYIIRIAAMETLCPLNNVRLLVDADGGISPCGKEQLSDPLYCRQCVAMNIAFSGGLHTAEREMAGFHEPEYPLRLRRAVADAFAVFVVNPTIADLLAPHNPRVHVVPSGFDAERFPKAIASECCDRGGKPLQILFAGLTNEYMKGFHVLLEAGKSLWSRRQDFEIVATGGPVGRLNEFTRLIGWQSQEQLPFAIAQADILVFPTLAEEGLGRSAVEAMACGRPVVASRIGGLKWVVEHNRTGLLHEPGDVEGLVAALGQLLNDGELRRRLGLEGRKKFESEFTWEVILDRHYNPLFCS